MSSEKQLERGHRRCTFALAIYWNILGKRGASNLSEQKALIKPVFKLLNKYHHKKYQEPWFILTSLSSVEEVMKIYASRSGIEAMFKDCKTGGYNLEGTKANTSRLTRIILLIAIAYTSRAIKGEILKKKAQQKYIVRPEEKRRKTRRHSEFWVGLYGELWCHNDEKYLEEIKQIMLLNRNKLTYYQKGLEAMSKIEKVSK